MLLKVASRNAITFVAECHGSRRKIEHILSPWLHRFQYFYSPMGNVSAGGLLCLVQRTHMAGWLYDFEPWVAGRVGLLDCWTEHNGSVKSFSAIGAHNHNFSRSDMHTVVDKSNRLITKAKGDPLLNTVALIGDFNLPPVFGQELRLDTPEFLRVINASDVPERVPCKKPFQKSWEQLFDKLTELEFRENNHVNIVKSSTNCLNRCFVSIPASGLISFRSNTCMYKDPVSLYADGISDHAPIMWFLAFRVPNHGNNLRLKPEWCKHVVFKEHCETKFAQLEQESGEIDPFEALAVCKNIFREAACKARDHCFAYEADSKAVRLAQMSSIARVVWNGNMSLAKRIHANCELGFFHLNVSGNFPCLRDPILFEKAFAEEKSSHILKEKADLELRPNVSDSDKAYKSKKAKELNKKAALFKPIAPYLSVVGLSVDSLQAEILQIESGIHRESETMVKILKHTWEPIFATAGHPSPEGDRLLDRYCKSVKWDFSKTTPPTQSGLQTFFKKSRDSAPGIDGVANAAWRNGGSFPIAAIHNSTMQMCSGRLPPIEFNDGLWLFPPKKVKPTDPASLKVIRTALECRPLTLNNSDNKAGCGLISLGLSPALQTHGSQLQRGFIQGRQLLDNPVILDTHSRINAMRCTAARGHANFSELLPTHSVAKLAVTALFDYAHAFASVKHSWIMRVCERICVPEGARNFIAGRYSECRAFIQQQGEILPLFQVLSGVLQGCPLSSTLFTLAIDPLLWIFSQTIVRNQIGVVCACADDIAIALHNMSTLKMVSDIFNLFSNVSGLTLAPHKCILILVSAEANPHNIAVVQQWLAQNVPGWSSMAIDNVGVYLGFALGPKGGSSVWSSALKKFGARVTAIKQAHECVTLSVASYNSLAVSCLGYIAQLALPPANVRRLEVCALNRVLHLATNSLSLSSLHHLRQIAQIKIIPITPYMQAAMSRAAFATVSGIDSLHSQLCSARESFLCLPRLASTSARPAGWDSVAYVDNLHNALNYKFFPACAHNEAEQLVSKWLAKPHRPLQSNFRQLLEKHLYSDWSKLVHRRLTDHCPGYSGNVEVALANLEPRLCLVPMTSRVAVIKTICNSWCTSCRYHEVVRHSCIFGCNACHPQVPASHFGDELSHYLVCPRLWSIIREVAGLPIGESASDRLGITTVWLDLRLLALAHHIYHSLKLGYEQLLGTCTTYSRWDKVIRAALEAGAIAKVDLFGEVG